MRSEAEVVCMGEVPARPVRVLVVDDSASARDLLARGLALDPAIAVVGTAVDAYAARDAIVHLAPDVMTLDVEMSGMDGIEFLRRLIPQYPLPVVIVSAVTAEGSRRALEALEAGAVDVVGKPRGDDRAGLKNMVLELCEKVKAAAFVDRAKIRAAAELSGRAAVAKTAPEGAARSHAPAAAGAEPLIAIGASTGGTAAITRLLEDFPEDSPPTLIVQHMPPVFTAMFAASLDRRVAPEVREAADRDRLRPGLVLVAPGDEHLRIGRDGQGLYVRCVGGPKVSGHRPSVDVLFHSVAEVCGTAAVGFLMTGMGRDGADGLRAMRRAGARCLAQDEASSVVFGMPREAWMNGAAERLVPLSRAAMELLALARSVRPADPPGGAET